jgi:hypothetical protein
MADFPAIEPTTRSFDLGEFSTSAFSTVAGGDVYFLHGEESFGHVLELTFERITEAEMKAIRAHYRGQDGDHVSFELPPIILQGHPDEGLLPIGGRWVYAAMPDEDHNKGGKRHNVTVPLRFVGYELPSVPPP